VKSFKKPDKLSHIKQFLEIGSIIAYSDDYISSDQILRMYGLYDTNKIDLAESTVKRAVKAVHTFLDLKIFESKPSFGYRLKKEFRANRD